MEYAGIAVKGAVAAVDGNIPSINCSEHVKYGCHTYTRISSDPSLFSSSCRQRMFIWNNIFLTFAFNSRESYADVGGE